jgi:predicted neutral ceramidase superfamily lipid hydrolase
MELDELKILWKDKQPLMQVVKSELDFSQMLGKKTKSITGKLKRSLWIEIGFCITFLVAFAIISIQTKYPSIRMYFGIFAFVFVLFIVVLFALLKKINKLTSSILPVKVNLQQMAGILKEFVKRYFQLTMALIPVSLGVSFLLGYNDATLYNPSANEPLVISMSKLPWVIAFLLVYIIGLCIGMYYFTRWYLKKLYGKHIQQLDVLIKELED